MLSVYRIFCNPSLSSKLFFCNIIIRNNGKKSQGPRDIGKYKSSEWLLEKMAISLGFWFHKIRLKCWNLQLWIKKTLSVFLLRFSNVTFHLEIFSANMKLTHQSMIIQVKRIYKAMQCYKCRKYFKNKQESWNQAINFSLVTFP